MAQPESSVNVGLSRLRIRDLPIVSIHESRKRVLDWFDHVVVVNRYSLPFVVIDHAQL
jgi:hypothetical protein